MLEHANTATKTALVSKFVAKIGQAGPMAEACAAGGALLLFGTATTADVIDYAYALRLLMLQERRRNGFNRVNL